jgi:hypothetical protein
MPEATAPVEGQQVRLKIDMHPFLIVFDVFAHERDACFG